jgi:arylsulfatase A-like enzyme
VRKVREALGSWPPTKRRAQERPWRIGRSAQRRPSGAEGSSADDAIHWLNQLNDINPEMPFFVYYVPGGTHAPHHATPKWIKKISDMHLFDKGWNALRDQIFANQKKLGVIPADAKLTPCRISC